MLKSDVVIGAQTDFLSNHYANAGRGVCARVEYVDDMVSGVRCRVAEFMNADAENIVFTSGATDAFNRIVNIINLNSDMGVAVSDLDHHSARVPFEMSGAKIVVCPLDESLNIDTDKIPLADVLIITAMSNVLGVPQDVVKIINAARQKNPNVIAIVDAAQFVVHESIDVKKWDADFVVWSGHKIGSDTGVGVMYIKNPNRFRPDKFGGGMINSVSINGKISFVPAPDVFEAGTMPLTQIVGLGVAIDEIEKNRPDLNLIKYLYDELKKIERVKIITSRDAAILSFVVDGMHVLDFGALVGAHNVCIRVGNMCASWIHHKLKIDGSIRVSVGAYNTLDDINIFLDVVRGIIK